MATTGEPQSFSLPVGSFIADRYEVQTLLGKGAMGRVYKVIDRHLENEVVALKILDPALLEDQTTFARFRHEVLVARKLSHDNIVRIHDFGSDPRGWFFITMEYVDGVSLKDVIKERGKLSLEEILFVMHEVSEGIAYAHEHGIVHRDLKPDNVMLSNKGKVKLADFGLARNLLVNKGLTETGNAVGTPYYMSPEQNQGGELDSRTDLYSLGVMGFELATGRVPFQEETWFKLAAQHILQPTPKFARKARVPSWFEKLIFQLTEKKREKRIQKAERVAALLERRFPRKLKKLLAQGTSPFEGIRGELVEEQQEAAQFNNIPKSMRMGSFRKRVQESLDKMTFFGQTKKTELEQSAKEQLKDQVVDPKGRKWRSAKRINYRLLSGVGLTALVLTVGFLNYGRLQQSEYVQLFTKGIVMEEVRRQIDKNTEGLSDEASETLVRKFYRLIVETYEDTTRDVGRAVEQNKEKFSERAGDFINEVVEDDAKTQSREKGKAVKIVRKAEDESEPKVQLVEEPAPKREWKTRLRARKPEGKWVNGKLAHVSVEIWNAGEVTAEDITVIVTTPDRVAITLDGPTSLERKNKATFSKSEFEEDSTRAGRIRVRIDCKNCR